MHMVYTYIINIFTNENKPGQINFIQFDIRIKKK